MKNRILFYMIAAIAFIATAAAVAMGDITAADGVQIAVTAGIVSVKDLRIYIDVAATLTAMGCAQDATYNRTREMIKSTCKDSGDFAEYEPGEKDGTLSFTNLLAFDHTYGIIEAHAAFEQGTKIVWAFKTEETGDTYFTGDGYYSDITINSSGASGPSSYSGTIQMTGTVTTTTNA